MSSVPLCTAPFTSLIIDTHKGVRPCCTWDDLYFGNLKRERLDNILNGPAWARLKAAHLRHEWPKGCINCREREEATGWSLRQSYLDRETSLQGAAGCYFSKDWQAGITYLELNSSNLCNLACLHCTGAFSSRWLQEERRLEREGQHFEGHGTQNPDGLRFQTHELHLPDEGLLIENLCSQDLGRLRYLNLKGGEPMLNRDVPALLHLLRKKGILSQVEIHISTNGTRVNEEILALPQEAGCVRVWLSVDGVGKVQEYIRHGRSSISVIMETIRRWTRLNNVEFGLCTSVMPYNIFSLHKIRDWWESLGRAFSSHHFLDARFSLMITVPKHLSLRILQDDTRKRLTEFYRKQNRSPRSPFETGRSFLGKFTHVLKKTSPRQWQGPYTDVIKALEQPYLGDEIHNLFVDYTLKMDEYRGTCVLDVVPELRDEMLIL